MTGITVSCDDWLNQTPFDKVSGEDLYKTEGGVEEALNGIYLGLLNRSLYGGELTVGVMEVLAGHYYIESGHKYADFMSDSPYSTSTSRSYLANFWNGLYKLVTECNVFLEQTRKNAGNYSPEKYRLYQGEALALRTFLHFDLLRLFGPACTADNQTKRAIPYYDHEMNQPEKYSTVAEITEILMKDINAAIALLADDPIYENEGLAFQGKGFWGYRSLRMNIYAAYALKARMCLHFGDKPQAFQIATALLEDKNPDTGTATNFNTSFPLYSSLSNIYIEPVMFSEVVFGMHDVDRKGLYKQYFSMDQSVSNILLVSGVRHQELFQANVNDYRYSYYGDAAEKNEKVFLQSVFKFNDRSSDVEGIYPLRNNMMPLIRKGELYLIAAESSPDDSQKAHWLDALILGRNYIQGSLTGDLDQFLEDEYERELYCEGQYFYYLKRNEKTSFHLQSYTGNESNVKNVSANYFVMPVPDAETDNRVD